MGQLHPDHLRAEVGVAIDEVGGDLAGGDDLGLAVDVGEEGVQRLDPLFQPARQALPFGLG